MYMVWYGNKKKHNSIGIMEMDWSGARSDYRSNQKYGTKHTLQYHTPELRWDNAGVAMVWYMAPLTHRGFYSVKIVT